jgi:protein involved in polysaccharide export with SLBB domain
VAQATQSAADSLNPAPQPAEQPETMLFAVGDKLKVTVFERLSDAEDRWANQQRAARPDASFFVHQGMSGEVTVRADWRISIPLLGTFVAANRDMTELVAEISAAFERLINRRSVVSVDLVARQPIYVLGSVRTPGPYPFEAGLTPLHAVALAGGLRQPDLERGVAVEAIRELDRCEAGRHPRRAGRAGRCLRSRRTGAVRRP